MNIVLPGKPTSPMSPGGPGKPGSYRTKKNDCFFLYKKKRILTYIQHDQEDHCFHVVL